MVVTTSTRGPGIYKNTVSAFSEALESLGLVGPSLLTIVLEPV